MQFSSFPFRFIRKVSSFYINRKANHPMTSYVCVFSHLPVSDSTQWTLTSCNIFLTWSKEGLTILTNDLKQREMGDRYDGFSTHTC